MIFIKGSNNAVHFHGDLLVVDKCPRCQQLEDLLNEILKKPIGRAHVEQSVICLNTQGWINANQRK